MTEPATAGTAPSLPSATTPEDEARTRAILEYDVLGRPPEPNLQSLAELAAFICRVPTAAINLITATHQHQVAVVGMDPDVVGRQDSMCDATLMEDRPVVVRDARRDPRFADNPFVTGQVANVRFYAASQLRTPSGIAVGTLCVFDETERRLGPDQARALDALARQVVEVLELRRRTIALHQAVNEREDALAAAASAREELERSNEALSAFAGQVSHDLRNPLAAVSSCLETLADIDAVAGNAEAQRFLSLAQRATGGMHQLVDRMLTYARVGGTLIPDDVDLAALVGEVVETLAPQLGRASATVETGDLPVVRADDVQLRAVLENLLTNAVKFRSGEPPLVRVAAERRPDAWRITVTDNGMGIPAQSRAEVFGAFRRLPNSRAVDGFGLGLATCRRIVRAHGGDIGVEDGAPGGGTTVWFTLPDRPVEGR